MTDRNKAEQEFLAYTAAYDIDDPKIRLKVDHTLRVASLCVQIAKSLSLDEEDTDTAYLAGLLHDIGRFEQVRIYHTFRDSVSVNHAMLSADLLFKKGLAPRFYPEREKDDLIEKSIHLHNAYRLPDELTDRERMFCCILRDADKIDILRVNLETPMTEIYDLPEEAFLYSEISDPVYEDMLAHHDVNRANSKTGIDFMMGHVAFVYGLVYPASIRIMKEQGHLDRMLSFESRNESTRKRIERIRSEISAYVQEKVSQDG